jgi:hypothetical protein
MAMFHHGKEKPVLAQVGKEHGVERSQEPRTNSRSNYAVM